MKRWLLMAPLLLAACSKSKEPAPTPSTPPHPSQTELVAPAQPSAALDAATVPTLVGPIPPSARQLMVTLTEGWTGTDAEFLRYERSEGGAWTLVEPSMQSAIGHTGLAWGRGAHEAIVGPNEPIKHEGDGKSPAGVFAIGKAYGYEAMPEGTALPYQQTSSSWRCVNDSTSTHYNRVVDTKGLTKDWNEAEKMRRNDELYRLVIEVDHNRIVPGELAPVPEGGSCIFLHVWRSPGSPTIGCTAMSLENMQRLVDWLDPQLEPHLVALPRKSYQELSQAWALPPLTH